jgi:ankyrin repeat domain-containing protein 50
MFVPTLSNRLAMIIAKIEDDLYSGILNTTRAILFFGTPHRGTVTADLPQVMANVANLRLAGTGRRFRSDLLDDLKADSRILNDISNSFRTLSPRFKIISFYETESTGPLRKLVRCLEYYLPL